MAGESSDLKGSKWFHVQHVPKSHTFSPQDRPGNHPIPTCKSIPIIDFGNQHTPTLAPQIIQASQEYGLFQVCNHGVGENVIKETMKALEELFSLPPDELWRDADAAGWMYFGSTSLAAKGAYLWRDNIKHPCLPLQDCIQHWPQNPPRYRDAMAKYIAGIRRLSLRILEMISGGLGLEEGYIGGISQAIFLSASNYPPCPDPALTLGLLKHQDPSLITIVCQGNIQGIQVLKDGHWIGVEAVPNSLLVNIGTQLQVISNGKLRSAEHRVVTNSDKARICITTHVNPCSGCVIEPAKELVNEDNPALYPQMPFKEFAIPAANQPLPTPTHSY